MCLRTGHVARVRVNSEYCFLGWENENKIYFGGIECMLTGLIWLRIRTSGGLLLACL
jgi:hypothetical protein